MPDDVLKQLLDAERRAEGVVESARLEKERIIEAARRDARALEERFEARIPEIRETQVKDAERRAERSVAELEARFQERRRELRRLADEHEEDALRAALALLTDDDACER
jgi:V/A-type H+-transporting ATPase subunit G/H